MLSSKSLTHLNHDNNMKHKPSLKSSQNIAKKYFNHSKFYQYITTEIQLITTVIHQHLTISNSNHSASSPSRQQHRLHSSSSSSKSSLNGSASSYTVKQWQINNFFQNLLKQFEHTRFAMSFYDSLVIFTFFCG